MPIHDLFFKSISQISANTVLALYRTLSPPQRVVQTASWFIERSFVVGNQLLFFLLPLNVLALISKISGLHSLARPPSGLLPRPLDLKGHWKALYVECGSPLPTSFAYA